MNPEEIQKQLNAISDQLKSFAEKAQKEISAHSQMSADTKASVDKLLITQGELNARMQAAEQLVAKIEQNGQGERNTAPQSFGQMVTESEEFKAFAARNSGGTTLDRPFKQVYKAAALTEDSASGGDLIVPQRIPGIFPPGQQRLFIRDLINFGRTTSNAVEFVRESGFTNNAAPVSENPSEGKPESVLTYTMDSAPVATIAHYVHASRQIIADVPQLQGQIDGRLRYGLKLKEEAQLLLGSGAGLNLNGIYTQATAYSRPAGAWVQDESLIDRLRLALLQAELANAYADGIVLHPTDWANVELTKDLNDQYLFVNPRSPTLPSLWGRNVVPTQSMTAGTFLVGAFGGGLAVQGHDREDVTVRIAEEDQDDFVKNMIKILVEERLTLTVYRTEAFVKGDFDGVTSGS